MEENPKYGNVTFYGTGFSDLLASYNLGDQVVMKVTAFIDTLGKASVTLEVTDCELMAHAESWEDAAKRADNKLNSLRSKDGSLYVKPVISPSM